MVPECSPRPNSPPPFAARNRPHSLTYSSTHLLTYSLFRTGEFFMSNTMRWRYGDTGPVMLPVDSATVIEIGDVLYLDTDDAKPASSQPDQGSKSSNQQLLHDNFAGVAMQSSRSGDTQPI